MMREKVLALLLVMSVLANGYLLLLYHPALDSLHPGIELFSFQLFFVAAKLFIRESLPR